jgi:hypothetical protein
MYVYIYTCTYVCIHVQRIPRHVGRRTDGQTDRRTDGQAGRQTETDRQTDRQVDRQTDRQTGRQTGRQTDRQNINLPNNWQLYGSLKGRKAGNLPGSGNMPGFGNLPGFQNLVHWFYKRSTAPDFGHLPGFEQPPGFGNLPGFRCLPNSSWENGWEFRFCGFMSMLCVCVLCVYVCGKLQFSFISVRFIKHICMHIHIHRYPILAGEIPWPPVD